MTGDLAKGCIGIANQDVCDVCKMLIKDELTRKLDRYNDTKLKRMYKLTDQDIYKRELIEIFTSWRTKIWHDTSG